MDEGAEYIEIGIIGPSVVALLVWAGVGCGWAGMGQCGLGPISMSLGVAGVITMMIECLEACN